MRVVADIGNTRLKVAQLQSDGKLGNVLAEEAQEADEWCPALHAGGLLDPTAEWAVCSVRPAAEARLRAILVDAGVKSVRWFNSAADVAVPNRLTQPWRTGADRALAVLAGLRRFPGSHIRVVLCGTALTVEFVESERGWLGGAISPGLRTSSRLLHSVTAQLPLVVDMTPPVPACGAHPESAIRAGVVWGVVGAAREILARQHVPGDTEPQVIWAGGDAERLAPLVEGRDALIVPHLVLEGLSHCFGDPISSS